jgi:hypothetical protein
VSWRFDVFEQYLVKIAEAKDDSVAVAEILAEEPDPYLRQLLLFHFGRRCVISATVRYAMECHQSESQNQIGPMIRAMVVAGRSSGQIAAELGTDPASIRCFEKIYFDVRRFLENRAWLKRICFPPLIGNEPAHRQAEVRWLAIAYERQWAGLAPCFLRSLQTKARTGREELSRFCQGLLSRAADFVAQLEIHGVPPSERDVFLFQIVQEQAKKLGLGSISLSDLDYADPLELDEDKARHEAARLLKGMPLEKRKKIRTFLESVMHRANQSGDEQPTTD